MRLGIVQSSLGSSSLADAFARAAGVLAEGIEISLARDADVEAEGKADEIRALSEKSKLAVPALMLSCLCSRPALIGSPQAVGQSQGLIRKTMVLASAAGVPMVVLPFFGKNAIEVEAELTVAADALLDLRDEAEERGVVLGVESTLNFDQQRFLLDHVGNSENVRIYQDTGNALARKLDLPTGIRELGPGAIAGIHYKDVRIAPNLPPDYSVALGRGNVDFRAVTQALQAVGYAGWVVLETPATEDPLAAAKANLAFARSITG